MELTKEIDGINKINCEGISDLEGSSIKSQTLSTTINTKKLKNNSSIWLCIANLNHNPKPFKYSINLREKKSSICQNNCSQKGSCDSNQCDCKFEVNSGYMGKGCEFKATRLKENDDILFNIISHKFIFFFIKKVDISINSELQLVVKDSGISSSKVYFSYSSEKRWPSESFNYKQLAISSGKSGLIQPRNHLSNFTSTKFDYLYISILNSQEQSYVMRLKLSVIRTTSIGIFHIVIGIFFIILVLLLNTYLILACIQRSQNERFQLTMGEFHYLMPFVKMKTIPAKSICTLCNGHLLGQNVRIIPTTKYLYHSECLRQWFNLANTCPENNVPISKKVMKIDRKIYGKLVGVGYHVNDLGKQLQIQREIAKKSKINVALSICSAQPNYKNGRININYNPNTNQNRGRFKNNTLYDPSPRNSEGRGRLSSFHNNETNFNSSPLNRKGRGRLLSFQNNECNFNPSPHQPTSRGRLPSYQNNRCNFNRSPIAGSGKVLSIKEDESNFDKISFKKVRVRGRLNSFQNNETTLKNRSKNQDTLVSDQERQTGQGRFLSFKKLTLGQKQVIDNNIGILKKLNLPKI